LFKPAEENREGFPGKHESFRERLRVDGCSGKGRVAHPVHHEHYKSQVGEEERKKERKKERKTTPKKKVTPACVK